MSKMRWTTVLMVGLCVVMVASGCRSRRGPGKDGKGGYDSDLVNTSGLDSLDVQPLGELRFDEADFYSGRFQPVFFAYDSSVVEPSESSKIEAVVEEMRQNANSRVIVGGHCDERGSPEYNLALGERRALAVRAYMTNLGIDGERIQTRSFGEEQPVAPGHDEESWSQNRRGEFSIAY